MAELRTFDANDDPNTIVETVKNDGGAIIANLMDPALVDRVNLELEPWVAATPGGRDDFTGRQTTRTGALVARSPACREVVMDPMILAMANEFLAPYTYRIQLHLTRIIRI